MSYTTFKYSDIKSSTTNAKDTDAITISFKVKNTGTVAGKEIAELYVHEQNSDVARPENELKHFEKISLLPGEEKTVSFQLNSRDFAYYNTKIHDWTVRTGKFAIRVGGSSRDLPLQETISIENTKPTKVIYTRDSMEKEIKNTPKGEVIVN